MLKEFEKSTVASLADEGFNGREIAELVFGTATSTNVRDINDFLTTYECDQLRGLGADYGLLEDWHLSAVKYKTHGFSNNSIAEQVLGSESKVNTIARFFKTSLAHELLAEITEDTEKNSLSVKDEDKQAIIAKQRKLNILYWDIETSPCLSYHYQHWKVNIRQDQAVKQSHLLSISYAFNDEEPVGFKLDPEDVKDENDLTLVVNMIEAIEKADIIVGYNSKNFDLKVLNTRALYWDLAPIKPTKHIDLYEQIKKTFRFPSNSLGNVSSYLQLEGKLINEPGLWRRCMEFWNLEECEKALEDMLTYNKQDIVATRDLYYRIRGWTKQTANLGAITNIVNNKAETLRCSKCASDDVAPIEGSIAFTNVKGFQMYRCNHCGGVSRISASGLVGCPVS